MDYKLENKLKAAFPKIFDSNFIFECGDGWYNLIYNLSSDIQKICDKKLCEQVKAAQVKEKFGGLRYYIYGGNEQILNLIDSAEMESLTICEESGNFGELVHKGNHVKTLCPETAILLGYSK
jgi:hypothetical protein